MVSGAKNATFVKYISEEWNQLPIVVKQFSKRALLLLVFWFIGYYCVIRPDSRVDNALTLTTTKVITYSLNHYYKEGFSMSPQVDSANNLSYSQIIHYHNGYALKIAHPCNGLNLFLLYIGFLLCVPGSISKKTLFSIFGLSLIFILNVFRCYALAWLNLNKPEWTDFAHHYAFTTIVYAFIFLLWVLFLSEKESNET